MRNFQSMIEEAQNLVRDELENREHRPDYISEKQLCLISDELDKMQQIRNIRLFCPHYPRTIIDGWDHSDPLANTLLALVELYRKL